MPLDGYRGRAELSVGHFFVTRPDPTHLLNTMHHKKGCQS